MIDKKLKDEIRLYYETHDDSIKEVSQRFNILYRTLAHWIKKEGWQRAKGLKDVFTTNIKNELVKKEFGTIVDATSEKIKQNIKANLGDSLYNVDELVQKNILDSVSDELLLKAMGVSFLQKNMALGALIAKDELLRMLSLRKDFKADPVLIACAEKFVSILQSLQKSFYGENQSYLNINALNKTSLDLDKLSEEELLELLSKEESKET